MIKFKSDVTGEAGGLNGTAILVSLIMLLLGVSLLSLCHPSPTKVSLL